MQRYWPFLTSPASLVIPRLFVHSFGYSMSFGGHFLCVRPWAGCRGSHHEGDTPCRHRSQCSLSAFCPRYSVWYVDPASVPPESRIPAFPQTYWTEIGLQFAGDFLCEAVWEALLCVSWNFRARSHLLPSPHALQQTGLLWALLSAPLPPTWISGLLWRLPFQIS